MEVKFASTHLETFDTAEVLSSDVLQEVIGLAEKAGVMVGVGWNVGEEL